MSSIRTKGLFQIRDKLRCTTNIPFWIFLEVTFHVWSTRKQIQTADRISNALTCLVRRSLSSVRTLYRQPPSWYKNIPLTAPVLNVSIYEPEEDRPCDIRKSARVVAHQTDDQMRFHNNISDHFPGPSYENQRHVDMHTTNSWAVAILQQERFLRALRSFRESVWPVKLIRWCVTG